jgi:predicted extracellular nuclease
MVYTAVITSPSLSQVVLTVGDEVVDLAGNAFAGGSFTYNVTGLVPIATVQGQANTSPVAGKVLQIEGTITGVSPFEGFFMQDANAPWSGIWVAYGETSGLKIGDGVHAVGTVAEVSSVTTLNATEVTEIAAPLTVVALDVASPSAAKNEMYESVLVKVSDAMATEANDIGNWTIYTTIFNNIVVANWLYDYTPLEGATYHVAGIVNARLEAFRLEPRMASDIEAGSILTVQGKVNESPWAGRTVHLAGTVTGISPSEGFFMQDANAGWSGIWVAYGNTQNLAIGDGVEVAGTVAEIATVTAIDATSVTEVAAPLTVEAIVVDSPAAAKNEMYESVLVKVEGARANAANDIGLWTIYYQAMNNITVANWMYEYTPEAGHFYDVTGILNTRLEAFKLEPRIEADVVDLTPSKVDPVVSLEFKVYPNPFSERIYIDNFDKLTRVVINNIAGQRVMDIEYPEREIRTAHLVSGVYLISLMTEEGIVKTERIVKR